MIIAGGCVLSCILPGYSKAEYKAEQVENFENQVKQFVYNRTLQMPDEIPATIVNHGLNGFFSSDIDLFVYGITELEASRRVEEIIKQIIVNNGADVIMRSHQAITILGKGQNRDIQIVFRLYTQPAEVILGFDIDCASILYDFSSQSVFCTERCALSLNTRTNVLNQTRRSTSYATRLIKYAHRGFSIVIPGFSRNFLLAEEIPGVSKDYKYHGENKHFRTSHEDLYI